MTFLSVYKNREVYIAELRRLRGFGVAPYFNEGVDNVKMANLLPD